MSVANFYTKMFGNQTEVNDLNIKAMSHDTSRCLCQSSLAAVKTNASQPGQSQSRRSRANPSSSGFVPHSKHLREQNRFQAAVDEPSAK